MATVTSLTKAKIEELMAGWTDVALSQDEINSLLGQLLTDVDSQTAALTNFQEVVLPDLAADLAAGSAAVNDLVTNALPDLESDLAAAQLSLTNVNTAVLPLLQTEITSANNWILELNDTTLPELYSQLDANNALITEFNTVTLPALNTSLADAAADVATLQGKFPITAPDIQAGAVTTNKIAAGAVTANEIAAGTITAEKIAADTITATEIAANAITVNELAANAVTTAKIDAFAVTANQLSTNAVIARTILADAVTAGKIAADAVTAREILAGTITAAKIAADTITSTEIAANAITVNELAAGSVTAAKIVAGTITANEIASETITATQIAAGSITALQLDVESIAAAVIATGILQAQLTISGIIQIDGTNMSWSANGFDMGNGTVFYPDTRVNQIAGSVTTNDISIQDGLSLGGNADLHGTFVMKNGITTPTGKMSLGQTWPHMTTTLSGGLGNDVSNVFMGLLDYNTNQWLVAGNFFGAFLRIVGKASGAWGGDLTLGTWRDKFYPIGGLAAIGTDLYILGRDGNRNNDIYIYRLNGAAATVSKLSERKVGGYSFFDGKRPRLVSDGTKVGMIWVNKTTTDLTLRWFVADLSATSGADITLISGTGTVNVGDAYYGVTDAGGPTRLLVSLQQGDSGMVRAFTTAGARVASEDFPRANGSSIIGLSYDSAATNQRLVSLDAAGDFWTYSKYKDGGSLNAQHTDYDGDNSNYPSGTVINGVDVSGTASGLHETSPSPVFTYALSKRAWPTITAPAAPDELVTDATQVDKANRKGIYASIGGTPRLQSYLAVGVRTLPLTDELSTSGALAGASGVQSFANASVPAPGRFRSTGEAPSGSPIIDLLGSGAGRMGHVRWDSTGKPLNHGEYVSVSTQSVNPTTFTTRTGWSQRDNTHSPAHGISVSSGVFTISQSGLWHLAAGTTLDGSATTNGRRITAIYVNGTAVLRGEGSQTAAAQNVTPNPSGVVYLAAGDQVEVKSWHNHTAAIAHLGGDGQNYFTAYCVAAF